MGVSPELHWSLTDYAEFCCQAYGEAPQIAELVAALLEGFRAQAAPAVGE